MTPLRNYSALCLCLIELPGKQTIQIKWDNLTGKGSNYAIPHHGHRRNGPQTLDKWTMQPVLSTTCAMVIYIVHTIFYQFMMTTMRVSSTTLHFRTGFSHCCLQSTLDNFVFTVDCSNFLLYMHCTINMLL